LNKSIWIINQYTGGPKYGMNYRSYYLAKEFKKNGAEVAIFAGSYSHLFSTLPKVDGLFTNEKVDEIDFIWVKTPVYKSSKSIGRMWNMLVFMLMLFFFKVKSMKKPDVIIISSLSLFPIINAYFWAKKFDAKLIFEIRDLWPQTLIELGNMSSKHPLVLFLGFFEKFGYKHADRVVSLLANSKKYMQDRGMIESKFKYIPNGVDLNEVLNSDNLDEKFKSKIPQDKFIVGYVGTLGIANALDYLIEAAKELSNYTKIHFVIVGKGGEKENLINFVSKENLNNVTFIEAIPKRQVQSMLSHFGVCYIGLRKEPLFLYGVSPNKLFDYMYSAKPILYAIDSGTQNLILEANCGISIEAENMMAISTAILKLLNLNNDEIGKMGINGKEYVLKYHTYKNLAKEYEEIFE